MLVSLNPGFWYKKNMMKHKMKKHFRVAFFVVLLFVFSFGCEKENQAVNTRIQPEDAQTLKSRLALDTVEDPETGLKSSSGTFAVFENRSTREGRMIHLNVVVLHAEGPETRPDPLFVFAGGPGADVTAYRPMYERSWIRKTRDIVLVSQRGTAGDNKIDCPAAAPDDDLQSYFSPLFKEALFRSCLEDLKLKFDLTQYSTYHAADDYNDVRQALGYDKVNITGSSYGTRMALVYLRSHPETVRTAVLNGVVPLAFRNPLYHAPGFQRAVDLLIEECSADPDCRSAYPSLKQEYESILARLEKEPAAVTVRHPETKKESLVRMSKEAFIEALRTYMYNSVSRRQVPYLIHRAYEGDYQPFAEAGLGSEWGIRRMLAVGMLLCVTCAEDLDRITWQDIEEIAGNTDMGGGRATRQKTVCECWPRSELPENFDEPLEVDVPVLLLSGTLDPVTPPQWGEEAAGHLPNSLHVVVPGAHGVGGDCIRSIQKQFLETASLKGLNTSCVDKIKTRPFRVK